MGIKRSNIIDMKGCFSDLPEESQELVMVIVSNFHYRTTDKQHDGSLGEIKITLKELNNALAYAMRYFEGERLD